MTLGSSMQNNRLELVALSKHYSPTSIAVDGIDLTVPANHYCCLLGPSGCGKTSTLRMIAGHETVTSGDIILGGHNITDASASSRGTAMMFQSYALFPHLNALDNVAFSLKMRGVAKAERHQRAKDLLERVAMSAYAERFPSELSGGQQQRVAVARALASEPAIIFADEPTGNLDTESSREIMAILDRLNKDEGITVILVTHEPDIAAYAGREIVIKDGQVLTDRRTDPAHPSSLVKR